MAAERKPKRKRDSQDEQISQKSARIRDEKSRPLLKLTQHLLQTYIAVNNAHYSNTNTIKEIKSLGKGGFGEVALYKDNKGFNHAIKKIKNQKEFTEAAKKEIYILQILNRNDPYNNHHIIRMRAHYLNGTQQCIVFEPLDCDLHELIKKRNYKGLPLFLTYKYGIQLLEALQFLKTVEIIHCDIKPKNIMLCHPRSTQIKLIDFGSSCFIGETMYTYIQSRYYRSPEILLGRLYDESIDMWSLGCVLCELYTGKTLFHSKSSQHQMELIIQKLGPLPARMLPTKDSKIYEWFYENQKSVSSTAPVSSDKSHSELHKFLGFNSTPVKNESDKLQMKMMSNFVGLIKSMLKHDPHQRINPTDALKIIYDDMTNVEILQQIKRYSD